jgi:hypothetical protein
LWAFGRFRKCWMAEIGTQEAVATWHWFSVRKFPSSAVTLSTPYPTKTIYLRSNVIAKQQ